MIGRSDLTIEDLNKAISLDPKFVAAYAHRGLVYAESGEQEKALADFNKTLELDPNNTEIYMKRGILHADAQRFDDAIKDVTTFIEFSPKMPLPIISGPKRTAGRRHAKSPWRITTR